MREKQRPVINLVTPVAQATEMTKSTVKREHEMAESKTLYLKDDVKTSTDRSQRISCNTKGPLD